MQSKRPISEALTLPDAIRALQSKKRGINKNAVVLAFYRCRRMRRVVRHALRQWRAEHYATDIYQDLALLFATEYLNIPDPEKIYNVMHVAAANRARRWMTKAIEQSETSLDWRMSQFDNPDHLAELVDTSNPSTSSIGEKLDWERALAEFAKRTAPDATSLPQINGTNTPLRSVAFEIVDSDALGASSDIPARRRRVTTASAGRVPSAAKAVKPTPSADGIKLNRIRVDYGYSLARFASALGIFKGTLSSYLYGAVQAVPPALMDKANELVAQGRTKELKAANARLRDQSMAQIVEGWIAKFESIGLDRNTALLSLQAATGVNRSTVWRWTRQDSAPDLTKVRTHDEAIAAYMRELKKKVGNSPRS